MNMYFIIYYLYVNEVVIADMQDNFLKYKYENWKKYPDGLVSVDNILT